MRPGVVLRMATAIPRRRGAAGLPNVKNPFWLICLFQNLAPTCEASSKVSRP